MTAAAVYCSKHNSQHHSFEKNDTFSAVSAASSSSEAASDEQESPEVEQLLIRQRRDDTLTFTNDTEGEYGKCRCTNARQCRCHGYKNSRTKNAAMCCTGGHYLNATIRNYP